MGRMDQHSFTGEITPSVRLVSCTSLPYETLFCIWWGSRHSEAILPNQVVDILGPLYREDREVLRAKIRGAYPEYGYDIHDIIQSLVANLISSDLPPLESINLTFELDNVTVAFREQLVRGRQAGYWTQTSRTMDLQYIDVNRSASIERLGGKEAVEVYDKTVQSIREAYATLQGLGVPGEDIRLSPSSQVHRVYWMINLRVLLKVLRKRSDWIAQSSLWSPIMSGILSSLYEVFPLPLYKLVQREIGVPAVEIKDGKVISHHYDIENYDRYTGKDPQPCDPLWLAYHGYKHPDFTDKRFYNYLKSMYINIWPKEYLDILGWSKEDVSKSGPYDI